MSLFLREFGVLCASGFGKEAFAKAVKRENPPTAACLQLKGDPPPPPIPYLKTDLGPLKEFVPPRATRRMDVFGRIALLLAAPLLRGLTEEERRDLGLIVATGYGSFTTNMDFLDTLVEQTHAGASPLLFSSTVHNSAMAAVAIQFGLQGPACTLSMFDASPCGALVLAETWMAAGDADRVLLVVADDVPELALYQESRMGTATDQSRPETLLAEGGAAFLFERRGPWMLSREVNPRSGEPLFGGSGNGSVSHAYAYGKTFGAPAFELCAAALELAEPGAGGITVDFSSPGGEPMTYRLTHARERS